MRRPFSLLHFAWLRLLPPFTEHVFSPSVPSYSVPTPAAVSLRATRKMSTSSAWLARSDYGHHHHAAVHADHQGSHEHVQFPSSHQLPSVIPELIQPLQGIEYLFEAFFYIMVLMAVSATISGAASAINAQTGLNYYTGIGVVGAIIFFLTIFGAAVGICKYLFINRKQIVCINGFYKLFGITFFKRKRRILKRIYRIRLKNAIPKTL